MTAISSAARRTGRTHCELCGGKGREKNPLTRHHVNGIVRDNDPDNHLVVHRILCHTFADWITQACVAAGETPTRNKTLKAWQLLMLNDWLMKLLVSEVP